MQIPRDVTTVGWYRHGPVPGEPGSAVIAGHVDSRTLGPGAFFDLGRLRPGDVIEATDADGVVTRYAVQGRRTIDKQVVPLDAVFARQGPPRLTLITCGGAFDDGTGHYVANVIVEAVPLA